MIPIYRANKIDCDDIVKGYFQKLIDGRMLICHVELVDENSDDFIFGEVKYTSWHKIDTSTLEISFDEGTSWYSMDEIEFIISQYKINSMTCNELNELPNA